jgi:hypothetical protein
MSSTQYFQITRAPEEPPLTAKEMRHLIWNTRNGSEWEVVEIKRPLKFERFTGYGPNPRKIGRSEG